MLVAVETPVRHVRIPKDRWVASRAQADQAGTDVAKAINALLDLWLGGDAAAVAAVAASGSGSGSSQPSGQAPSTSR